MFVDFALNIAEFGLQALVILICFLVTIAFIASLISKNKDSSELKVTNINKKMAKYKTSLLAKKLSKKEFKKKQKEQKNQEKKNSEQKAAYVLAFDGDIKASATEQLRAEISTLLAVAEKGDHVVLKLESPGGMVHGYGLAASQLMRIKDAELNLTVCIDKIAASGGYMMACIADKIVSAPFAIIGSIGVVASVPNIHKILKKNDVDYLEITAGEFKRTLTPLGEITEPKIKKFKEQIEEVHTLFKDHVGTQRPNLDLEKVATGEYWYGQQALNLKLVDELGTSDDYILKLCDTHQVFKIEFVGKKSLKEKISESLNHQLESTYAKVANMAWKSRYQ